MAKLQVFAALLVALLSVLGLGVLLIGVTHLYQDHLWDDQIRAIQRQQLSAPKPPPSTAQ